MSLENQSTNDLINSIDYNPKKKYTIKDIYRTLDDLTQITEHEIFSYFLPSRQVEYLKMNYTDFNEYTTNLFKIENNFRINDCFKTLLYQVRNLRKNTKFKHIESFGFEFESILGLGISKFLDDYYYHTEEIDQYNEYFTDYEHECSIDSDYHECENTNFICDYCVNEDGDMDERCNENNRCDHCMNECDCQYNQESECDHKVELITKPLETIKQLETSFEILHNTFGLEEINQSMGKHTTVKLRNYQRYSKLMNLDLTNQFSNLLRLYGKLYKITRESYFTRLNRGNHFCYPNNSDFNLSEQLRQTHKSGDIRYKHFNFKHNYRRLQIELRVLPMFSGLQTAIDIEKLMLLSLDWILNNIKTKKQTIVIKSNIPKFRVKPLNKFGIKYKIERVIS